MNEFEFISWLRQALDRPVSETGVPVGIGDDMAVIDFLGGKLLLGSDMVIENIHFTPGAKPEHVGHKALGRCLSDCAAMAGEPVAAIVSVARPPDLPEEILKCVFQGMVRLADRFHCPIVGGDTAHSEKGLVLDVCLLGKCQRNEPTLRSTAKVGDHRVHRQIPCDPKAFIDPRRENQVLTQNRTAQRPGHVQIITHLRRAA
jgi:thiamine-monophosphate kinase